MALAFVAAGVLLSALAGGAAARNLSISNQNLRAQFREVRFSFPEGTVNCQLTMEGSFHTRTLAKVVGSLVGYVTRVGLGPCFTGSATVLTETLPWHVRYLGFSGILPNIATLTANVIGVAIRVTAGGFNCLARTEAAEPLIMVANRNTATGALESAEIGGIIRTGFECFGVRASFTSDRGVIGLLNAVATRITVTLI